MKCSKQTKLSPAVLGRAGCLLGAGDTESLQGGVGALVALGRGGFGQPAWRGLCSLHSRFRVAKPPLSQVLLGCWFGCSSLGSAGTNPSSTVTKHRASCGGQERAGTNSRVSARPALGTDPSSHPSSCLCQPRTCTIPPAQPTPSLGPLRIHVYLIPAELSLSSSSSLHACGALGSCSVPPHSSSGAGAGAAPGKVFPFSRGVFSP